MTETTEEKIVGPLLTTSWSQGKYYNEACPASNLGPDKHSITGCAATALAQVLNYYKYPSSGTGSTVYSNKFSESKDILTVDFSKSIYKYDEMPSRLKASNPEVARLLYHCGVAMQLSYSSMLSGLYNSSDIIHALTSHFNYNPDIKIVLRRDMQGTEIWNALICSEIDAMRPLIYIGMDFNRADGHVWVCDGYKKLSDNRTYFHMNWGWDGQSDGYFLIGRLSPSGDFNYDNLVYLGVKPNSNNDLICRIVQQSIDTVV